MKHFHRPGTVKGFWFPDRLQHIVDGDGVVVKNNAGNVMFTGTTWLFNKCWELGWFIDAQE